MFGFFKGDTNKTDGIVVNKEMQETKERFFVFISKLEDKLREFTASAIPELMELGKTDESEFKGSYLRMKAAVLGQLESIQKKAAEVKEEKITGFYLQEDNHETTKAYYAFRNDCYERYLQLDELYSNCRKQVESTYSENYEEKYQKILEEHAAIKDKFSCVQCGSAITIDKIYFTTTYLACPSCQTQNTFEPSSQAKMLEHIGRSLAEQRTAHLLEAYDEIPAKTQALYLQKHDLEISLIRESDKKIIEQKTALIKELEQQQQVLEASRPVLYQRYLRAMFDEWNKINPALINEHEKFYTRLLNENKQQQ